MAGQEAEKRQPQLPTTPNSQNLATLGSWGVGNWELGIDKVFGSHAPDLMRSISSRTRRSAVRDTISAARSRTARSLICSTTRRTMRSTSASSLRRFGGSRADAGNSPCSTASSVANLFARADDGGTSVAWYRTGASPQPPVEAGLQPGRSLRPRESPHPRQSIQSLVDLLPLRRLASLSLIRRIGSGGGTGRGNEPHELARLERHVQVRKRAIEALEVLVNRRRPPLPPRSALARSIAGPPIRALRSAGRRCRCLRRSQQIANARDEHLWLERLGEHRRRRPPRTP